MGLTFYRGEQKTLNINALNGDGTIIALASCSNIIAYFIQNNVIIKKFALVTEAGYDPLTIDGVITNQYHITPLQADTLQLVPKLNVFIQTKFFYSDGTKIETVTSGIPVIDSPLANE